jgi:hypothetical protein
VTYKFHGFREIEERDNIILLEHDLERVYPFPGYLTVHVPLPAAAEF